MNEEMLKKLENLTMRYDEIMLRISEPGAADDARNFQKLMKEQSELSPIADAYREYTENLQAIEDCKVMIEEESDPEMKELAKEELSEAKDREKELSDQIKILLIPKDPNDEKNVIVEVRAGTGGDEAALFAFELYRMYAHYAEENGWKIEVMDAEETGIGGVKSISFMINGKGAYSKFKYESGTHRVQRVPETESGGRIHTSAATVAVLPEAEGRGRDRYERLPF